MEFRYICVSKILHFHQIMLSIILLIITVKTSESAHIPEREFQSGNQSIWSESLRETIPQQNEGTYIPYQSETIPNSKGRTVHSDEKFNQNDLISERMDRNPMETQQLPRQQMMTQNGENIIGQESTTMIRNNPYHRKIVQPEYAISEGRVRGQPQNLGQSSRPGSLEGYIHSRNLEQERQMRNNAGQQKNQEKISKIFNSNVEGTYTRPNIQNSREIITDIKNQRETITNIQSQREIINDHNKNSKIQNGRFESTDMINAEHQPVRESGSLEGFHEKSVNAMRQQNPSSFYSNLQNYETDSNGHGLSPRKEELSPKRKYSTDESRFQNMRPHSALQQSKFLPYRDNSRPDNMLNGQISQTFRNPLDGGTSKQEQQERFIPNHMAYEQKEPMQHEYHNQEKSLTRNIDVPSRLSQGESTSSQREKFYQTRSRDPDQGQAPSQSLYEQVVPRPSLNEQVVPRPSFYEQVSRQNQQSHQEAANQGRITPQENPNIHRMRIPESTSQSRQEYENRNEKHIRPGIHNPHVESTAQNRQRYESMNEKRMRPGIHDPHMKSMAHSRQAYESRNEKHMRPGTHDPHMESTLQNRQPYESRNEKHMTLGMHDPYVESTLQNRRPYESRNEKHMRPEIHDHVDTWHDHLDTVKDIRQDQVEASLMFGNQNLNLPSDIHHGHSNNSGQPILSIPYTADKWADHVDTIHDIRQDQMEAAMYLQHHISNGITNNQNAPYYDTNGPVSSSQESTSQKGHTNARSRPSHELLESTKQHPGDLLTSSRNLPWEGMNYEQGQSAMMRQGLDQTFKEGTWDSGNQIDNTRLQPKLSYWEATSDVQTRNYNDNTRSRSNSNHHDGSSEFNNTITKESNGSYLESKDSNGLNLTRLHSSRKNQSMVIKTVDNSKSPPTVNDKIKYRNINQHSYFKQPKEATHHRQNSDGYQNEYPVQPAEGMIQYRHGKQGPYDSQRFINEREMTASKRQRPVYPEHNWKSINPEGIYLQEGQVNSRMTNRNSRRVIQESTGQYQGRSFQGYQGQGRESTYPYEGRLYQRQNSYYDQFRPRYYNQPERGRQTYSNGAESTDFSRKRDFRNEGTENRKNSKDQQEKKDQESETEGNENKETTRKRQRTQDYEPEDSSTTSKPDRIYQEQEQTRLNYDSGPQDFRSRERPVNRFRERYESRNLGQGNMQNEGILNEQIGSIQRSLFEGTDNSQNQNINTVANQNANPDPYRQPSLFGQINPRGQIYPEHNLNDNAHQSNDRRFKFQNSRTSTIFRSNNKDQHLEQSIVPSSEQNLKPFRNIESTTSSSFYTGKSVLNSNNMETNMNSENNGTVKFVNDTYNGLKIEPVIPPSSAAGSATFGVIIGLSVAFLVILSPLICLLCRIKKKRDSKKKRLQASYDKNIEDNGMVEAMIMSDLGKGMDTNEYKTGGASGGHGTKYNEYSSYVNDVEETKYLKSHSEPVIHHAIVH